MEKVRKLKDFLIAFKKEFLNVINFLGKKDFNREEINTIKDNVCDNVDASVEEKKVIAGIFGLNEPAKVHTSEESITQNNVTQFPQANVENPTNTLEDDGGVGYARTYRSGTPHSSLPTDENKAA